MGTVESEIKKPGKNKGGRPKKAIRCNLKITVMCNAVERMVIKHKAKTVGLTVSEYLRKVGYLGQIDRTIKTLPKEVLQLTGDFNHMAANINQIAHKRNRGEELNAIERAELNVLANKIKELVIQIKTYLK
jgi:peptidoglycan hydrolase CwlO-like protein